MMDGRLDDVGKRRALISKVSFFQPIARQENGVEAVERPTVHSGLKICKNDAYYSETKKFFP